MLAAFSYLALCCQYKLKQQYAGDPLHAKGRCVQFRYRDLGACDPGKLPFLGKALLINNRNCMPALTCPYHCAGAPITRSQQGCEVSMRPCCLPENTIPFDILPSAHISNIISTHVHNHAMLQISPCWAVLLLNPLAIVAHAGAPEIAHRKLLT